MPHTQPDAVEVRAATVQYGGTIALNAISLRLAAGQTHVLLGSSGSGKSTLLRAMLGLVPCSSGDIRIGGASVAQMSPADRVKLLGYVPQDAGLFPHLSAEANVTLVARAQHWRRARIRARLAELTDAIGIEPALLRRHHSELSGGQRQRIALMRGLFLDPGLLVLDEPFSALDPLVRAELQSEMRGLFVGLGKTVVFVTHDVGEAGYLSDNIVLLHAGQVVQQGPLEAFRSHPADPFVTEFLGAQRVLDPEAQP